MTPEQLAQLQRDTRSSIELTRNSKSEYQWVIKRYYENGEHVDALQEIGQIDDQLRAEYLPQPSDGSDS